MREGHVSLDVRSEVWCSFKCTMRSGFRFFKWDANQVSAGGSVMREGWVRLKVGCDKVRCENGVCFCKWDARWVCVRGGGMREGCVSLKVRCKEGVCFWNWNVRGVCACGGAMR